MIERGVGEPSCYPPASVVEAEACRLSAEIFSLWRTLNSIVVRREEVFRKRWTKKNKNSRAQILLKGWPNMPTMHRPDFWAMDHPKSRQQTERYLNSFRYPHINLEDLTERTPLLLLLNARARNPPSAFAHDDIDRLRMGIMNGKVRTFSLEGYQMCMGGEEANGTYGKLVRSDEDEDVPEASSSDLHFMPALGCLALMAEHKVLDFLIKCCHGVFQDLSSAELISLEIPAHPEPPLLTCPTSSYVQLSTLRAEAPYRVRAPQDFQALNNLFVAGRAAALDHIWDL